MTKLHKELYRKDLNDPDNHDGVITHLEPDILECEVKSAITTNKASGGDGIPFDLWLLCVFYSLNIWKFTVHILLKPGLKNFEHYLASM